MNDLQLHEQIVQWLGTVNPDLQHRLQIQTPNLYLSAAGPLEGQPVESAICAHLEWRDRLEQLFHLNAAPELDPAIVGQDNQCAIGRWLQGGASPAARALPEFAALRERHSVFHAFVGELITEARQGRLDQARARLDSTEYTQISWNVIQAIAELSRTLDADGQT